MKKYYVKVTVEMKEIDTMFNNEAEITHSFPFYWQKGLKESDAFKFFTFITGSLSMIHGMTKTFFKK